MRKVFEWTIVLMCLASLFGGFACLLWAGCFDGPPEALYIGLFGLPAFFLFGNLLPKGPSNG